MPFFIVFGARLATGWDESGSFSSGCLLAVITYMPIYKAMSEAAGSQHRDRDVSKKSGYRRHYIDPDETGLR